MTTGMSTFSRSRAAHSLSQEKDERERRVRDRRGSKTSNSPSASATIQDRPMCAKPHAARNTHAAHGSAPCGARAPLHVLLLPLLPLLLGVLVSQRQMALCGAQLLRVAESPLGQRHACSRWHVQASRDGRTCRSSTAGQQRKQCLCAIKARHTWCAGRLRPTRMRSTWQRPACTNCFEHSQTKP